MQLCLRVCCSRDIPAAPLWAAAAFRVPVPVAGPVPERDAAAWAIFSEAYCTSRLSPIDRRSHSLLMRAMSAAEERTVRFNPMADDSHSAMIAFRRERFDRTFKAVENMRFTVASYLHHLV